MSAVADAVLPIMASAYASHGWYCVCSRGEGGRVADGGTEGESVVPGGTAGAGVAPVTNTWAARRACGQSAAAALTDYCAASTVASTGPATCARARSWRLRVSACNAAAVCALCA